MKRVVHPGEDFTSELDRGEPDPVGAAPASRYPAQQRDRERAVLDLTNAAQAATCAAILLDRGLAAESYRLTLLAQQLYDQADSHRLEADRAHCTKSHRDDADGDWHLGEWSQPTSMLNEAERPTATSRKETGVGP